MLLFPSAEHTEQILIMDLMKRQSSWEALRWQDGEDIYLNLTEQKVLWTSSTLKASTAPDDC